MKITTTTAALASALAVLTSPQKGHGSVIETSRTVEIATCALLCALPTGQPSIEGCDFDVTARCNLPGEADRGFRAAVNARALKDAIAKVKASEVEIAHLGDAVTVRASDGSGATIRLTVSQNVAEFPSVPTPQDWSASFTLPAGQTSTDLAATLSAASKEQVRYYLNGVLVHAREGEDKLHLVATDGHRLVRASRAKPDGADALPDAIIPRKAAALLAKVSARVDGVMRFDFSPAKVRAKVGQWHIVAKLIDGTFPDYERVIPKWNRHKVAFDGKALATDALAVTSHFASKTHRRIGLGLGAGWATLWGQCPENGAAGSVVSSMRFEGEGESYVYFNQRYLSDALALCPGEGVLEIEDPSAPTLIRCKADPGIEIVLMPVRDSDRCHTPDDVRRLTMTPIEKLEQFAPGRIDAIKHATSKVTRRYRAKELGEYIKAAIDHLAGTGERHQARVEVLSRVEELSGSPGRWVAMREAQPQGAFHGNFAAWSSWEADRAPIYARRAAERAAQSESAASTPPAGVEALERRVRRLTAVLEGRKRQLATVGEALAISRNTNAALRRQILGSGVSSIASASASRARVHDKAA